MINNNTQICFSFQEKKTITINFAGGNITSDAGLLPIRQYDEKIGFTQRLARIISDKRKPCLIHHDLTDIVRQRLYGIIAGYEDANDSQYLCNDPVFLTITGNRLSDSLASQPTISRFETSIIAREVVKLNRFLLDHYLNRAKKRRRVIIDVDSTDDPCHGGQQLALFNGFYEQYMYHQLLFFEGTTGDLLGARLRPGNVHGSHRLGVELERIVKGIQERLHPKGIILRSDAAAASPHIYETAEKSGVDYLISLPVNSVLKRRVAKIVRRVKRGYKETDEKVTQYTGFWYKAQSWDERRRVVVKIEYDGQELKERFLVTSLRTGKACELFRLYGERGESENWIKEFKNNLKGDRLSCHGYVANAFRLLLFSCAYVLVHNFRSSALKGTALARATIETIRLKLIKVGALVKETVRRLWFYLSSGWPFRPLFIQVCKNLGFDTS